MKWMAITFKHVFLHKATAIHSIDFVMIAPIYNLRPTILSIFFKTFCINSGASDIAHESVTRTLLKEKSSFCDDGSFQDNALQYNVDNTKRDKNPGLKVLEKYNLGDVKVSSFPPTFNFAAYIEDSSSLQELVKLGVNLYKWERRKGISKFILQRDFFKDMAPYVKFLHDVGVPADNLGRNLTTNPLIFKEDLEDLKVRVNYLESKNFTQEMISRIVTTNPYWLMFSTQKIDRRLGYFQKTFHLSGNEVRQLAVTQAKLITSSMDHIKTSTFVLKEELGLTNQDLKKLLLRKPRLFVISNLRLKKRFEYVHLEMKIPHELILENPEILTCREFKIKERHLFLKSLKRDKYNPKEDGYVSLKNLVVGTNTEFAVNVAKASVDTFNTFLKTL